MPAARGDELFGVFAQQVGLQIHRVTDFAFAQGGDFVGVGNYPDAETFFCTPATVRLMPSTATEPLKTM